MARPIMVQFHPPLFIEATKAYETSVYFQPSARRHMIMQQAVMSSDLKERILMNAVSSLGWLQVFKNERP